jgi:hypothetical protein
MSHSRSSEITDIVPLSSLSLLKNIRTPVLQSFPSTSETGAALQADADIQFGLDGGKSTLQIININEKNKAGAGRSAAASSVAQVANASTTSVNLGAAESVPVTLSLAPAAEAAIPYFSAAETAGIAQARSTSMALTDLMPTAAVAAPLVNEAAFSGVSSTSNGRGMVVGNVPVQDGQAAIVDQSGGLTMGVTNQTAVDALAVNTAEAQYLAATGSVLNGAGLKIGILSDSFNFNGGEAAQIANGDLPSAANIHIVQEGTSGNDEGQALAELIHSIAPAAQIYFYSGVSSQAAFAAGITSLTGLGMNVIVDDITYSNEPFYQDTGVITQAAEAAVAAGVSYFTSAGNSGNDYYEAGFSPIAFALPGIGTETTQNILSNSPYEAVSIGADATLDFTLEWDQAFGANQYDLGVGLYSYAANAGYTLVENFTTSSLGGDPVLSVHAATSLTAGTYYLAFYESGSNLVGGKAVTPGEFKIINFSDSAMSINGYGSGGGSGTSIGHELAPGVNSVAAVSVVETPSEGVAIPVAESFSSIGIGKTYINAAGVKLATPVDDQTPSFAATDGSPTSVFDPFYGTSAAAANAAAVGLLVLQADTRLVPAQVSYLMAASALPTYNDSTGGAGLVQASTAVAGALLAGTTPIWTGQGATLQWGTAANWSDTALPLSGSHVQITNGLGLFTGGFSVDFNTAAAMVNSLDIDGGYIDGPLPALDVMAGDALTTGSLTLGAGSVDVAGTLFDTGALLAGAAEGHMTIENTGHLTIGGAAAGEDVAFAGIGGSLVFGTGSAAALASGVDVAISDFAAGDVIDLRGLAESSVNRVEISGASVKFVNAAGATVAALNISGATNGLSVAADGAGGTELVAGMVNNSDTLDVAGDSGVQTVTVAGGGTGTLDITNIDSLGAVTAGVANISLALPAGYNTLLVSAPGSETILGNGAANFTAIFAANSTVTFNTNGGNGTISAAAPGDFLGVSGTAWSVVGAAAGGDTVAMLAANSSLAVYGAGNSSAAAGTPSNLISLEAGNISVASYGTDDLVESYATGDAVSVHGTANVLVNGGAVTVTAMAGASAVQAFFENSGGQLNFINNSGAAASVDGAVAGAIGGNVTAFGGTGGGVYAGGPGGNNSLVGGAGLVTLYGGGTGNFLSASSSLAGANVMFAGGGATTMVGAAGSGTNLFSASTGSTSAISHGSGGQVFFAGASGQDIFTGSTVSGAVNNYYFLQDNTGSGSDVITNFNLATDNLFINPFGGATGVSISQIFSNAGASGGVIVNLSDNTTIKLYGVSLAAADAATTAGGLYI